MLAERDVVAELRFRGHEIRLDDRLVLAVDKNRLVLDHEEFTESLLVAYKHIPGRGTHEDLDPAEL